MPRFIPNVSGRKKVVPRRVGSPIKDYIFISGGLGDVFAVESYLTDDERKIVKTIFLATRKWESIQNVWAGNLNYPSLEGLVKVWDDKADYWCFHSIEDAARYVPQCPQEMLRAIDLSISVVFNQVERGLRTYNGSGFMKPLLPSMIASEPYFVICPYSNDKRDKNRDFTPQDWSNTIKILERNSMTGIVINCGNEYVPKHDLIVDKTNRTTELEAIDYIRYSSGYLGIDSAFSVIAAKCSLKMKVKSTNSHLYRWKHIYYAPLLEFDFINEEINDD